MRSTIRGPRVTQDAFGLRTVDRDPVSMVGMERTLIRTDGVAVFPLGDFDGKSSRARHGLSGCDRLDGQGVRHACDLVRWIDARVAGFPLSHIR